MTWTEEFEVNSEKYQKETEVPGFWTRCVKYSWTQTDSKKFEVNP